MFKFPQNFDDGGGVRGGPGSQNHVDGICEWSLTVRVSLAHWYGFVKYRGRYRDVKVLLDIDADQHSIKVKEIVSETLPPHRVLSRIYYNTPPDRQMIFVSRSTLNNKCLKPWWNQSNRVNYPGKCPPRFDQVESRRYHFALIVIRDIFASPLFRANKRDHSTELIRGIYNMEHPPL